MTKQDPNTQSNAAFQQQIYQELDVRLRASPWSNGASEAHGLLCGLACVGITADTIRTRVYLLQLTDSSHIEMIEGMFSLVLRDLGDTGFGFNLMLPDDTLSLIDRAEALSSWCQGFLQGALHQDTNLMESGSTETREALSDIMEIGHLEIDLDADPAEIEHQLLELEEFLRVAVQVIYDELQPATTEQSSTTIN